MYELIETAQIRGFRMNPIKMLRFYFAVFCGKKNIETVQKLGLLSVKIGQIMALRPIY